MKTQSKRTVQTTTTQPEELTFVARSVSWRSDILKEAEDLVTELAKQSGRRANLSEFVNGAVQEKIARQRMGNGGTVIQDIIRKEIQCLLAPQLQQSPSNRY